MSSDKILSGQEQDSRQSHETSPTPEANPESAPGSSQQSGTGAPSETGSAPESGAAPESGDVQDTPPTATAAPAESTPETPIAAEAATEAPAAAAASQSAATDESAGEGSAAAPRRPRLQPTAAPEQARAIPSYGSGTAATAQTADAAGDTAQSAGGADSPASDQSSSAESSSPASADVVVDAGSAAAAAAAPQQSSPSTVEIPSSDQLDADIEAEIEAAMSSGEQSAQTATASAESAEQSAEDTTGRADQPAEEELEPGVKLTGKIQEVGRENVFLDLGYRSPGVVAARQFESAHKPQSGQVIEVVVDRVAPDEGLIYLNLPRGVRKLSGNWDTITVGQVVDCMVMKTNKGGLEVNVGSIRGFLPASQVELGYVSDLEPYVNQKLRVEITEANQKKRNLIVSRRAYLQKERAEVEKEMWQTLATGQKFDGTVKTIKNYGAFIDIGGTDGFLHIGEMSWQRIKHPGDVLSEGQQVEVVVISLDAEKKRIGLGMRQLTQNPWSNADQKFASGSTVSGTVTRIAEFGAFVELEAGVEGLIHISELDYQRVRRVGDVLRVGQSVEAQVLEVDTDRNRISLSLKALKEKPDSMKDDEDLAPGGGEAFKRKRKGPLKGGTGSTGGGGLFGNPNDFT